MKLRGKTMTIILEAAAIVTIVGGIRWVYRQGQEKARAQAKIENLEARVKEIQDRAGSD
jgi:hypothetical protein